MHEQIHADKTALRQRVLFAETEGSVLSIQGKVKHPQTNINVHNVPNETTEQIIGGAAKCGESTSTNFRKCESLN
jgi:hypothetical protein